MKKALLESVAQFSEIVNKAEQETNEVAQSLEKETELIGKVKQKSVPVDNKFAAVINCTWNDILIGQKQALIVKQIEYNNIWKDKIARVKL
jgi:hypothetical protein